MIDPKMIIRRKIEEHKRELIGASKFRDEMAEFVQHAREGLKDDKKVDIMGVKNMFGIYEKMKFHKICLDVLNELIQEIEHVEKAKNNENVKKN